MLWVTDKATGKAVMATMNADVATRVIKDVLPFTHPGVEFVIRAEIQATLHGKGGIVAGVR